MRHTILIRSVRRFLDPEEQVHEAVYMWSRHRLMVPYAVGAFIALVLVAIAIGVNVWPSRAAIGAAGAAVAAAATTTYRVLALTDSGLVLLRASRVRRCATGLIHRLPPGAEVHRRGGNMLTSDWSVDGSVFAVLRRDDRALGSMCISPPHPRPDTGD